MILSRSSEEISETKTERSGSSRRCVLFSELRYFSLRFFAERKASTTSPSGFDANRHRSAYMLFDRFQKAYSEGGFLEKADGGQCLLPLARFQYWSSQTIVLDLDT